MPPRKASPPAKKKAAKKSARSAARPTPAPRSTASRAYASPDDREAEALRLFAEIEGLAGRRARALAEGAAANRLESFVRRMGHDYMNRVESLFFGHRDLTKVLEKPELDRAALEALATRELQVARRFSRLVERTREAVLHMDLHMCEEPVAPLVEEVRAAVTSELGDRASRFDFTADVEDGLTLHADHPYLLRALTDLVKNAAEAYPPSCPRAAVRLTARARGRSVEIVVADVGYGWSAETLGYAFVPFGTSKPEGAGLGLYLARRDVEERHGGRLTIESEGYTLGSRVRVVLPRRQKGVQPRRRLTHDEIFAQAARRRATAAARG